MELVSKIDKDIRSLSTYLEIKVLLNSKVEIPIELNLPYDSGLNGLKIPGADKDMFERYINEMLNREVKKRVVKIPFDIEKMKKEFNKILDIERKLENGVATDENIEDLKDKFKRNLDELTNLNKNVNDEIDVDIEEILNDFTKKLIEYQISKFLEGE